MAKFAQYYLSFLGDNLFAGERWAERQQLLGALLASEEKMAFMGSAPAKDRTAGGEEEKKAVVYRHKVYHLTCAPDITVMRIANVKEMLIEKDFHPQTVEHNPSCFVIFDNRRGCRRVLIQKLATSFSSTDQVMKILQRGLEKGWPPTTSASHWPPSAIRWTSTGCGAHRSTTPPAYVLA